MQVPCSNNACSFGFNIRHYHLMNVGTATTKPCLCRAARQQHQVERTHLGAPPLLPLSRQECGAALSDRLAYPGRKRHLHLCLSLCLGQPLLVGSGLELACPHQGCCGVAEWRLGQHCYGGGRGWDQAAPPLLLNAQHGQLDEDSCHPFLLHCAFFVVTGSGTQRS